MGENRDFKGVWIPKEIWINEDLSWMEKLFFVEIDSLDNENGCFASNNYFADFFTLSPQRCSQIINSLIKKKYMTARYEYKGKEIQKRVLNIFDRGIKYSKLGIKNSSRGYQEKVKNNNTVSNKVNNIYTNQFFSVTKEQHSVYLKAYPKINLTHQYNLMESWLISNPTKRPKSQWGRFVNSWLGRCKPDPDGGLDNIQNLGEDG